MINHCEKTDLTGISVNADVAVISINGLKDATTVLNVIMDMSEDFFLKLQEGRVTTAADFLVISSEDVLSASKPTIATVEQLEDSKAVWEPKDVTGESSEVGEQALPIDSSMKGMMHCSRGRREYACISSSSSSPKSRCSCHTFSNQDVK